MLKRLLTAFRVKLSRLKVRLKSSIYKKKNNTSLFSEKSVLFSMAHINTSYIGKYTYFAGYASVNNCKIGGFCSIADGVKIGVGMHPLNFISTHPVLYSADTIFPYRLLDDSILSQLPSYFETKETLIGNDVWIGTNSIVLDGVQIGDGAVIAAGSVVTKNVPDYAIVGGIPARIIKYRPIPEEINGAKWWSLDEEELRIYVKNKYNII